MMICSLAWSKSDDKKIDPEMFHLKSGALYRRSILGLNSVCLLVVVVVVGSKQSRYVCWQGALRNSSNCDYVLRSM